MISVTVDEDIHEAAPHERLIDLFNRSGVRVPHVCYHPRLGPIQTCDTCLVEVDATLVRACATQAEREMAVSTRSPTVKAAQRDSFDQDTRQPPPLLHGLRQQQRELYRPQIVALG